MVAKKTVEEAEVVQESGVTGAPELVEPADLNQTIADFRLLPYADQHALATTKGFETVEAYLRSLGVDIEDDPVVEIFLPVYDANDIAIPGLGRTVKVRQSTIDNFKASYTAQAGLSLPKFNPRAEDIVH